MNAKNLKPMASRSPEERREISRRAGLASAKKRRENKSLREIMNELLALPLNENDPIDRDILKWLDIGADPGYWDAVDLTKKLGICAAMVRLAQKGNLRAFELILKITGEYPTEKREIRYREREARGEVQIYQAPKVTYIDTDGTIFNPAAQPSALSYEEARRMVDGAQEHAASNC